MDTGTRMICIHGITETGINYADGLLARLGHPPARVLQWSGSGVLDALDEYRGMFWRPPVSIWHPIKRLHRKWISAAHEAAVWVCLYDRPDIHESVLGYVYRGIQRTIQGGGSKLFFVAHSLGTVVLLDALTKMLASGEMILEQIGGIVTMGCPLSFWREPGRLREMATPLAQAAQWVNCYDSDDLIAGLLAPLCDKISDVEVWTGGLFRAHGGYWNSAQVAGIVAGMIEDGR